MCTEKLRGLSLQNMQQKQYSRWDLHVTGMVLGTDMVLICCNEVCSGVCVVSQHFGESIDLSPLHPPQ